jgi:hypothetical protein
VTRGHRERGAGRRRRRSGALVGGCAARRRALSGDRRRRRDRRRATSGPNLQVLDAASGGPRWSTNLPADNYINVDHWFVTDDLVLIAGHTDGSRALPI